MIVEQLQKMDIEELNIDSSYFGISSENQSNEFISKMLLTNLLKRWEESKTHSHPRYSARTPPEHISLKYILHYSEIVSYQTHQRKQD